MGRRDKILRRARLDALGTLHHVILRGIEQRRIVKNVADPKNFVKRLGELSAATYTRIFAWALMTNHAHILLRSSQIGLSGLMRRFMTVDMQYSIIGATSVGSFLSKPLQVDCLP